MDTIILACVGYFIGLITTVAVLKSQLKNIKEDVCEIKKDFKNHINQHLTGVV